MGKYFESLQEAMLMLEKNEKVVFIGQSVEYPGTAMRNTLEGVDSKRLLELPVDEDLQMGIANGLALQGRIPVSIFPRWNFLFKLSTIWISCLNFLE